MPRKHECWTWLCHVPRKIPRFGNLMANVLYYASSSVLLFTCSQCVFLLAHSSQDSNKVLANLLAHIVSADDLVILHNGPSVQCTHSDGIMLHLSSRHCHCRIYYSWLYQARASRSHRYVWRWKGFRTTLWANRFRCDLLEQFRFNQVLFPALSDPACNESEFRLVWI